MIPAGARLQQWREAHRSWQVFGAGGVGGAMAARPCSDWSVVGTHCGVCGVPSALVTSQRETHQMLESLAAVGNVGKQTTRRPCCSQHAPTAAVVREAMTSRAMLARGEVACKASRDFEVSLGTNLAVIRDATPVIFLEMNAASVANPSTPADRAATSSTCADVQVSALAATLVWVWRG